jgi:hypothetical protein
MTAGDFRRIVLGMRDTAEGAHMGHPDFRVNGRIFASLNDDETRGMVVLTPEHQERFVREYPSTFEPESGAWGRQGCTRIHLRSAEEEAVGEAATLAWQNISAKGPSRSRAKAPAKRAPSKATPARRTRAKRRTDSNPSRAS